MKNFIAYAILIVGQVTLCQAQTSAEPQSRLAAEYYVEAYAAHYGLPIGFVRAIVQVESGWRPCLVSRKGAAGLMQLMPQTAARLGIRDRCDLNANVSGGVRYLAWLWKRFAGDLRLVAAAYLAGEDSIARRGLLYRNPEVFAYVSLVRKFYLESVADNRLAILTAERNVR